MDLRLTPEQEHLVDSLATVLAKHSTPEQVWVAEETGFDPSLWAQVHELELGQMAVGEASGGWGAPMLDLGLVAEQLGRAAASVPLIEAQVAARLFETLGTAAATDRLTGIIDGERVLTVALHEAHDDRAPLVPGTTVADEEILLIGARLMLAPTSGGARVESLGSMPPADLDIGGDAVELAQGAAAGTALEAAMDDWLTLTASSLLGVGA